PSQIGSPPLLRTSLQLGASSALNGCYGTGKSLLALDFLHPEFALALRSLSWFGFAPAALDATNLASPLPS
ncbi:unnamed protein product, partial [Effrenium voratum]